MKQDKIHQMQQLLLKVPKGKVTTYKELAHAMGTKGYRFMGQLLNKNPHPNQFPCYKVVGSDGKLGGFALGDKEKIHRLTLDGIEIKEGRILDFEEKLFRFSRP